MPVLIPQGFVAPVDEPPSPFKVIVPVPEVCIVVSVEYIPLVLATREPLLPLIIMLPPPAFKDAYLNQTPPYG